MPYGSTWSSSGANYEDGFKSYSRIVKFDWIILKLNRDALEFEKLLVFGLL